jgi:phosphate transport system protein
MEGGEMERHFDQQLEKLKTRLLKMCSLVNEQLENSIKAFVEGDLALADKVIAGDKKVDKYDVKIDKSCMKLLALNQPVAVDLRLVMAALTINTDLERIGDLAVNIAENVEALVPKPDFYSKLQFDEISKIAMEMVKTAIDSFIDNDPELAQKVLKTESILDTMVEENNKKIVVIMKENCKYIEPAIKIYSTFHELERVGDHATNIAEDVYFIVEAQNIKHRYEEFLFKEEEEGKPV